MFEQTKAFCDSFLSMGVPGFDLIVYQDGECILRHMSGYADLNRKIPIKGDESYNIYSCSKPITCVAAMQLWEKGFFSLEDRLDTYMPEFGEMTVRTENGIKRAENPILIRHLFEMTAGFSYNLKSPHLSVFREKSGFRCPTRETMVHLAKEPLLFEPGERWNYSLCHDVLAAFVEVVSKQRFEMYVRDHIFMPLGMNHSTFLPGENEIESLACQYKFHADEEKTVDHGKGNRYRIGSEYASGGAGCVSTVDDYIRFLEALRIGDVILKKDTIKLMATDRLNEQQRQTYVLSADHGYGLGIWTPKAGGMRADFGWGGAAGAYLAVDIPNGISLYYVQHLLTPPNMEMREHVYEVVLADIQGKKVTISKPDEAKEYKHTY